MDFLNKNIASKPTAQKPQNETFYNYLLAFAHNFLILICWTSLNRRWASSRFCVTVQLYYWSYHCSKLTTQNPLYFCFNINDIKKI